MNKKIYILIIFIMSIIFIPNVFAETGYVSDKTGVNMRNKPSTKGSEVILEIPYNAEFYISDLNVEEGDNTCKKSWYYVYYEGKYGYICSGLVKVYGETETSYDRPWTTPKKAIIGGAKFISNGYISKGQYTSYLKKFNVNPSGYYPLYNHQYMANLRAPMSESLTTYKSIKENGLLEHKLNFVIPIYNNMPETTYDENIKNTERQIADIQDETFENSINTFPEDYKKYLRYLHSIHKEWVFTPLITNLDFNQVFLSEQDVSSIEINSGLCEQNPYYETEKGWCIGNEAATKFFIDPRNFLSEQYIFMFENLSYSDLYTEDVIKSVLKDTFMNDISIIDNQTYASIFVEAGNAANINSLYLASLARQESGVKLTNTTNGEEFTYEGYAYKGIYNFFNIGANSSATNPAKAGLVYANGGKGANGAIKVEGNIIEEPENNTTDTNSNKKEETKEEIKEEIKVDPIELSNTFISWLSVSKTNDYIKGYQLGTSIASIKEKVGNNAKVIIKNSNGNELNDGDLIGTGYTIEISNDNGSNAYTYVMYGDLSGDGNINSADLLKLRQHLLGTNKLNGAFLTSAYLNEDENINSADLLKLRQHLLGTSTIKQ